MVASSVSFREAQTSDLASIIQLLADDPLGSARETVSSTGQVDECYCIAFEAITGDASELLAVAVASEQVIGTMQLSFLPSLSMRGSWRGQIENVRIDAAWRGSGVGAEFMNWAIDRFRERGCRIIQLTSNSQRVDAHRFYERCGFQASHRGFKLYL